MPVGPADNVRDPGVEHGAPGLDRTLVTADVRFWLLTGPVTRLLGFAVTA
jgi:hypothetical protein